MANIQYIGARYVPLLYTNPDDNSNDWKSGVAYDPLTVVLYMDDSYTSKKTVPANIGNPADNPNFWVKTGNYNAALTSIQNEISIINNDIEILKGHDDAGVTANAKPILVKYNFLNTLISGNVQMQGGAYNSSRNTVLICALDRDDNTVAHLIELDADDFTTLIQHTTISTAIVGHANGVTFNPHTNRYYIVCADNVPNCPNKLAVIHPVTLTYEDSIDLDPSLSEPNTQLVWHFDYDDANDRYIAMTFTTLDIYNSNFEKVSSIPFSRNNMIKSGVGNSGSINASAIVCNGTYWISSYILIDSAWIYETLTAVVPETGEIITSVNIELTNKNDEIEFLIAMNDNMYAFSGLTYYVVRQIATNNVPSIYNSDPYFVGVPLSASDNLDDVLIAGKYMLSNAVATTLDAPLSVGGMLEVFSYSYTDIAQRYICDKSGRICVFMRIFNSGTWGNWIPLNGQFAGNHPFNSYVSAITVPAIITGSSETLQAFIPLAAGTKFITAANVSGAGNLQIRNAFGQVSKTGGETSMSLTDADFAVTFSIGEDGITINVKYSGKWHNNSDSSVVTNNTDATITFSGLVISYSP